MPNVFDKFTTYYKKSIRTAIEIAKHHRLIYVEPEHLLYGIALQKGSVGFELLGKSAISPTGLGRIVAHNAAKTAQRYSEGQEHKTPLLSEASQQIIIKSLLIATEHNHRYIGTEHLLCAILTLHKNLIEEIFMKLSGDQEKLEKQMSSVLRGVMKFSELTGTFDSGGMLEDFLDKNATSRQKLSALETFAVDMTAVDQQKKIDPVIGREREIQRIIHILCRRNKNNPLLLGDPGVGKTAIVEGLAKKIAEGDVPDALHGKKIWKVDLAALIAGTIYRGEFEARLKQLMDEIRDDANIILFIDELHNVIGSGSASGSLDTANILKPALARGEMKLIGATTYAEYKKHIENDPAFERRLQIIDVPEPNAEKTKQILEGIKQYYEEFHNVVITNEAIESAVQLSGRYIKEKFLPDKAIDLIDEAAAKLKIKHHTNVDVKRAKEIENQILIVKRDKHQAVIGEDFQKAFGFKAQEIELEKQLFAVHKRIESKSKKQHGEVTGVEVSKIISNITGIPLESITKNEKRSLLSLEKKLNKSIIGQTHAITKVSQVVRRSRVGISDPNRPFGSFLFVGPSGVGKTETAKALSEILFDSREALIRIDMSEFSEKFNISKLIGSPAGYVGYKESNTLTDKVKRNPYSVILFDEIEKAHKDVYSLLLQILEDGHLTDAAGSKVNFRNTIIILTSNIGQHLYNAAARKIGFLARNKEKGGTRERFESLIRTEAEKKFRPEMINRLDEIIIFHPLTEQDLKKIAKLQIEKLNTRLEQESIKIEPDKSSIEFLAKRNYKVTFGARSIRRNLQELVENELAEQILAEVFKRGDVLALSTEKNKLNIRKKKDTMMSKTSK